MVGPASPVLYPTSFSALAPAKSRLVLHGRTCIPGLLPEDAGTRPCRVDTYLLRVESYAFGPDQLSLRVRRKLVDSPSRARTGCRDPTMQGRHVLVTCRKLRFRARPALAGRQALKRLDTMQKQRSSQPEMSLWFFLHNISSS